MEPWESPGCSHQNRPYVVCHECLQAITLNKEIIEVLRDCLESLGLTSRKNQQEIEEDYGTEGWRVYQRALQAIAKAEEK